MRIPHGPNTPIQSTLRGRTSTSDRTTVVDLAMRIRPTPTPSHLLQLFNSQGHDQKSDSWSPSLHIVLRCSGVPQRMQEGRAALAAAYYEEGSSDQALVNRSPVAKQRVASTSRDSDGPHNSKGKGWLCTGAPAPEHVHPASLRFCHFTTFA